MVQLLIDFMPFPPAALTDIGSHLPERGHSARVNARSHGVVGRLLQVRQAGSQPLAQSVIGTGVASVARLAKLIHERTARALCHRPFPVWTMSMH